MTLLPRKGLLAIAAVIDIALHGRFQPVSAKALAKRHGLPARHLEPVLQALVRFGILRGIRGPRGGYELTHRRGPITADEILRAAGSIESAEHAGVTTSQLLGTVVMPAIGEAEEAFAVALCRISVDDLVRRASSLPEHVG